MAAAEAGDQDSLNELKKVCRYLAGGRCPGRDFFIYQHMDQNFQTFRKEQEAAQSEERGEIWQYDMGRK